MGVGRWDLNGRHFPVQCFVAQDRREQAMWWTTDDRVERQPAALKKSHTLSTGTRSKPFRVPQKYKRLKLPISVAQATANLKLQESGADCNVDIPRLRKDIRCLEAALRHETRSKNQAFTAVSLLQCKHRQQFDRVLLLEIEVEAIETACRLSEMRSAEQQKWLEIAAAAASHGVSLSLADKSSSQHQISSLLAKLKCSRSENKKLGERLEISEQENRIFTDVISDMESRRTDELNTLRDEYRVLRQQHTRTSVVDRTEVQQLNIRIVSQAAEIRSLSNRLADSQAHRVCEDDGYKIVLDNEPKPVELNERLESSLQAVRTELDSAVHELTYANAETVRLQNHADCIEKHYEAEFHSVVQVAQLHATIAAALEQKRDKSCESGLLQLPGAIDEQVREDHERISDLIARNKQLSQALVHRDATQHTASVSADQLKLEVEDLRTVSQELESLREMHADLIGANETLSAFNQDLAQRLEAADIQRSESEQRYVQDKNEWQALLTHHERRTNVVLAECGLITSQVEAQRVEFDKALKQQVDVNACLNRDVESFHQRKKQLESALDCETINRTLAEQETERLKSESQRRLETLSQECEQLKLSLQKARGEGGDETRVRSAA